MISRFRPDRLAWEHFEVTNYAHTFQPNPFIPAMRLWVYLFVRLSVTLTASLASPRERKIPGSSPAYTEIFPGSSHTSDLKIGTPVATLPGAWRYRVSAGTGRPGISVL